MSSSNISRRIPWQRYRYHREIGFYAARHRTPESSAVELKRHLSTSASSSSSGTNNGVSSIASSKRNAAITKISLDKTKSGMLSYQHATQRMIQAPMGSFDSRAWHEAEWTMRYWNRQRTVESVFASLDLLDRFIKEYSHQCQQHKQALPLPDVLHTASLNFTIHNWQACAKSLKSPKRISTLPSPASMLEKVDYFRDFHNSVPELTSHLPLPLQPSVHSYSIIIDALAFAQLHSLQQSIIGNPTAETSDVYGNIGWHFTKTPAPIIAEEILHRLVRTCDSNPSLRPSIITFNSTINTWSRSRHPEAPERAQQILQIIQDLSKQPGWNGLHPTTQTYGTIIHTWANSNSTMAAEQAQLLVQEMKQMQLPLNGEIHLGVLKAWSSSTDPQAAERANELLQDLIVNFEKQWQESKVLKPPMNCILAVMNIFAKKGDAKRATEILEQLNSLYETCGHDPDLCPNADVFNCVLRAWSRSRSKEAYARCERILTQMRDLAENTGNQNLMPNIMSYNAALHALAKSRRDDALQRAEELFGAIEKSSETKPDLVTYNVMLHLIARSRGENKAGKAAQWLRQMWNLYSSKAVDFMPDSTSYNTCIDASRNDPVRAETLFHELEERYNHFGMGALKPTRISYGSLIAAWAGSNHRDGGEKAQQVFESMVAAGIRPTNVEYNATIHAWASVGNVDRAESILNKALDDYSGGNRQAKPNVQSFTSLLHALAKRKSQDPWGDAKHAEAILVRMEELRSVLGEDIKPNAYSFNATLDCFARCQRSIVAPKHAERILRHMQALYQAGNRNLKPTVISYTTVMNCWLQSRSEETVERVQLLFDELQTRYMETRDKDFRPSQFTYNTLIGAYARDTTNDDSLTMAMAHFDNMTEQFERTKELELRPGPMHFSVILSAYSRRGMAKEAEEFLERILSMCREFSLADGKKMEISSSFNGVIGAHARSKLPGAAEMALKTLRRMADLGPGNGYVRAPPNVYSYTTVMLAWSYVAHLDPTAITTCQELLHEMLESARLGNRSVMPNNFTFGTMLQVISRSHHPEKKELAEGILRIMQQQGIRPDSFVEKELEAIRSQI
ncbi:Pentatricopeptide repeat-containing protein [Seminavis robusta]|uniref:Pentatricopeptide repeat-containing protein n=1 Tax=Seminavis robusta TaxID=568900 RepID=A0A9N8ETG1_9STRA|nr:Pentatricopeptide repeat-containing protein [Seminavis robusta]|eukprot:Sro1582_g283830.1 Pentatricopeptide repeat-containing protein (1078) ;mRNA; f:10421-13654